MAFYFQRVSKDISRQGIASFDIINSAQRHSIATAKLEDYIGIFHIVVYSSFSVQLSLVSGVLSRNNKWEQLT
jgi:hypothetical protein